MRPFFLAAAVFVAATLSGCGAIVPSQPAAVTSPTTLPGQIYAKPLAAGVPSAFGWDGVDRRMMMLFPIHFEYPDRSVWTLDGATWKSAPAPAIKSPGPSMLVYDTLRNRVVLVAANLGQREDTWEWDGRSWRQMLPPHVPRLFTQTATAAYSPELHAVVVFEAGMDRQPTYFYDGTDWSAIATRDVPTALARMEYDPNRHLIVGLSANDWRTWLFDGVNWTVLPFRPPIPGIQPVTPQLGNMGRQGPAIALDERTGEWVVFGGFDASNFYADTWVGGGTSWTRLSPHPAPQPRSGNPGSAYLAWDPDLSRLVLFGGEGSIQSAYLSDTWTWDSTNWTQLS